MQVERKRKIKTKLSTVGYIDIHCFDLNSLEEIESCCYKLNCIFL